MSDERVFKISDLMRFGAQRGGIVIEAMPENRYRVDFRSHIGTLKGSSLRADAPDPPPNGLPHIPAHLLR
jgi:hypothetical protein